MAFGGTAAACMRRAIALFVLAISVSALPDTIVRRYPTGVTGDCSATLTITSDETEFAYEAKLDDGLFRLGPHFGIKKDAKGKQQLTGLASQPNPQRNPTVLAHELKGLTLGDHRVEIRALDAKGRRDPTPFVAEWSVRKAATQLLGPPVDGARVSPGGSLGLRVRSDAPRYGFEVKVDNGPWKLGPVYKKTKPDYQKDRYAGVERLTESPGSVEYKLPAGKEGPHEAVFRVFDACGNVGEEAAVRWKTAWVHTEVVSSPEEGAALGAPGATIELRGDAATYSYQFKLDGELSWQEGEGRASPPATLRHVADGLPDGAHSLEVRAVDAKGRADYGSHTVHWTVDTTPPVTKVAGKGDGGTPGGAGAGAGGEEEPWGFPEGELTWEVADGGGGGGACEACTSVWRLDGGSWQEAGTARKARLAGLQDGKHVAEVRSTDAAGNAEPAAARIEFEVHAAAPATVFVDVPDLYSRERNPEFHLTASKPDCTILRSLDGGEWVETDPSVRLYNLKDGEHTLRVYAVDRHGTKEAAPHEYTWHVDSVPPDTSVEAAAGVGGEGAGGGGGAGEAVFDVRVVDGGGGQAPAPVPPGATYLEYSVNDSEWHPAHPAASSRAGGGGWGKGGGGEAIQVTGLVKGTHTLRVRARDRAGNYDPTPAVLEFPYPPLAHPSGSGNAPRPAAAREEGAAAASSSAAASASAAGGGEKGHVEAGSGRGLQGAADDSNNSHPGASSADGGAAGEPAAAKKEEGGADAKGSWGGGLGWGSWRIGGGSGKPRVDAMGHGAGRRGGRFLKNHNEL